MQYIFSRLSFFLVLSLVFSGCSNSVEYPVSVTDSERLQFLNGYTLSASEQDQAVAPSVGVLLKLPVGNKVGICTVSHVLKGILLTNAHCVNPEVSVEDYFIVWVTSGGSTKWVSLSGSSVKAGTRGFKDYAWIQVPIEKIPDWSPVFEEGSIITKGLNADSYGSSNPVRVSVWTMTQTSADGSYDAGRYVSRFGARFQRKNCLASDRKPHVRIIDWQEQRQEGVVFENSAASLYLDNCDSNLVKGNSGSLVTTERNIKEIRGLFHTIWGVKPKDIPRIKSVEYFGSLGQWLAPSSYEHIWSVALSIQAIPLPDFQSNQL